MVFEEAIRQGFRVIYIEDLFWHDPQTIRDFRRDLVERSAESTGCEYVCLNKNDEGSYYSEKLRNLSGIRAFLARTAVFLRQATQINRIFLSSRIRKIIMGNDTDYLPRYVAILCKSLDSKSHLIQISGSNESYKDSVPFYPMFADVMFNWGEYHAIEYDRLYEFGNDVSFVPMGNPKMDKIYSHDSSNVPAQQKYVLVISNTQFYNEGTQATGDPLFLTFAETVLSLIDRHNSGDDLRVLVKLHPRETTSDLYEKLPGWRDEFRDYFTKVNLDKLLPQALVTFSMGSTAIYEGLLHGVHSIVLGSRTSEISSSGPWREGGMLVERQFIEMYLAGDEAEARLSTYISEGFATDVDDLEYVFKNLGHSAREIVAYLKN